MKGFLNQLWAVLIGVFVLSCVIWVGVEAWNRFYLVGPMEFNQEDYDRSSKWEEIREPLE